MITTPNLIELLVADAYPVHRLRAAAARAGLWLLFAAAILALLAIDHGLRPDLDYRLQQRSFIVGIGGSLLTGVLAAVAAFTVSLPDRSWRWLLLPLPALVAWLSAVAHESLTGWVDMQAARGIPEGTLAYLATLTLISIPLWLALLVILRHVAFLPSRAVVFAGSLAVAALAATALSLLHRLDASTMTLSWNLGGAVLVFALGTGLGKVMFAWAARR